MIIWESWSSVPMFHAVSQKWLCEQVISYLVTYSLLFPLGLYERCAIFFFSWSLITLSGSKGLKMNAWSLYNKAKSQRFYVFVTPFLLSLRLLWHISLFRWMWSLKQQNWLWVHTFQSCCLCPKFNSSMFSFVFVVSFVFGHRTVAMFESLEEVNVKPLYI